MGMKGSFVGMGTVVDLLFCTFPTFLPIQKGAGIDFGDHPPHFVPWWWGDFPIGISCSLLVPTTTQGMSTVLSLKMCLYIPFRALEFCFWIC